MANEKESATKVDLGLLEEDDEFEEFPADGRCHFEEDPWWTPLQAAFSIDCAQSFP